MGIKTVETHPMWEANSESLSKYKGEKNRKSCYLRKWMKKRLLSLGMCPKPNMFRKEININIKGWWSNSMVVVHKKSNTFLFSCNCMVG